MEIRQFQKPQLINNNLPKETYGKNHDTYINYLMSKAFIKNKKFLLPLGDKHQESDFSSK